MADASKLVPGGMSIRRNEDELELACFTDDDNKKPDETAFRRRDSIDTRV